MSSILGVHRAKTLIPYLYEIYNQVRKTIQVSENYIINCQLFQ